MAAYIEGLLEALGAAGARPVLRHEGHDVAGAALLTDVHRYARALDGLGIAAATSSPCWRPTARMRWPCPRAARPGDRPHLRGQRDGDRLRAGAFAAIPRTEQGKPDRAAIGAACAPARA